VNAAEEGKAILVEIEPTYRWHDRRDGNRAWVTNAG